MQGVCTCLYGEARGFGLVVTFASGTQRQARRGTNGRRSATGTLCIPLDIMTMMVMDVGCSRFGMWYAKA